MTPPSTSPTKATVDGPEVPLTGAGLLGRVYLPLVAGTVVALLVAFVVFTLYLIAGLRSNTYPFLGGTTFDPQLGQHATGPLVLAVRWLLFLVVEGVVLSTGVTILLELLRWRLPERLGPLSATFWMVRRRMDR